MGFVLFLFGFVFCFPFFLRKRSSRKEGLNTGMSKPSCLTNNVGCLMLAEFQDPLLLCPNILFLALLWKRLVSFEFLLQQTLLRSQFSKNVLYEENKSLQMED